MIDLAQRSEPYEIALPYGLSVTVKPLNTAGMAATQAAARRAVEAMERQARSLPARAPPMHYRDNLRRGHFWTPIGGQNSTPIDSSAPTASTP